jgi:dipeptidyl aminopeptidase/acylaminoacyl peptidase
MSEYTDVLEQIGERVLMPEPALERMVRRRERRLRNRRISAVVLGAIITAGLVLALARARSASDPVPGDTPTPSASNGWVAYTLPPAGEPGGIYFASEGQPPQLAIGIRGDGLFEDCPAFSPDGTRLAFTRSGGTQASMFVADVSSSGIVEGSERLVAAAFNRPCPEWAPDGQRLLYAGKGGLWSTDVNGAESPILIRGADPGEIGDAEWSPDGSLVAVAPTFDAYVWIVSAHDGAFVAQAQGIPHGELSWSPLGNQIVVGQGAVDGHRPVWLISPDDSAGEELTAAGRTFEGYGSPSWSPDGTSLALLDNDGVDNGIVIVRPGDSSWHRIPLPPVEAPFGGRLDVWGLRWSPDGQQLLVASGCSVHTMPADGSGRAILVSSPDVHPQACLRPPGLDWQVVPR